MLNSKPKIIFSDIGGVIATNGWDTALRNKVTEHFKLDADEFDSRHHLVFDSFERGRLSFEQYLGYTVFYEKRPFSMDQFRDFIFAQSVLLPDMLELLKAVKAANQVKFALISNEGGGITQHRVKKFDLGSLADYMVFSCTTGYRKPDHEMWRLGLDLGQVQAAEAVYIDDRLMFAEIGAELGFQAFQHTSKEDTVQKLKSLGFEVPA